MLRTQAKVEFNLLNETEIISPKYSSVDIRNHTTSHLSLIYSSLLYVVVWNVRGNFFANFVKKEMRWKKVSNNCVIWIFFSFFTNNLWRSSANIFRWHIFFLSECLLYILKTIWGFKFQVNMSHVNVDLHIEWKMRKIESISFSFETMSSNIFRINKIKEIREFDSWNGLRQ